MSHERTRLYLEIGARIRDARRRAGFTQAALADRISVGRTSLTNIEAGRQQPSIHVLYQIGRVLESELSEMLPPFQPDPGLTPEAAEVVTKLRRKASGGDHAPQEG